MKRSSRKPSVEGGSTNGEPTRREAMGGLAAATLSALSLGLTQCNQELLLRFIELLEESFALDENVKGRATFNERANGDTDIVVDIEIKNSEDDSVEAKKRTVVRVEADEDEGSWTGPKPVRRGQHTVEATAGDDTVSSDPFEVT